MIDKYHKLSTAFARSDKCEASHSLSHSVFARSVAVAERRSK